MNINNDMCRKLGFPESKGTDTEISYLKRSMINGHKFNTYICRVIGIGNLHSLTPQMRDKGYEFMSYKAPAKYPVSGKISKTLIIHIHMTPEQQQAYKQRKKKAAKE